MLQTKRIFTIKDTHSFLKQVIISEFDQQDNELIRLIYNDDEKLLLRIKKDFNEWPAITRSSTFDGPGTLKSSVIYEYDRNKNLIEKKFLNHRQQIISRQVWKYDKQNNLIKYEKYGSGEQLLEGKEYEYDQAKLISEKLFNKNRELQRIKYYFYDANDLEIEEKIFDKMQRLIALKHIKYNKLNLPELIEWYDGSGNLQRTEKFDYYGNKIVKNEIVDDHFANQYFRKKFDTKGNLLEAYHFKKESFENLEIFKYNQQGRKLLQEKYTINNSKKTLKQQIIYEYKDGEINKNNFSS